MSIDDAGRPETAVRRRVDVLWRCADGFLVVSTVAGDALEAEGPAPEIWELLESSVTVDDLFAELARRHAVDVDQIRSDVGPFIDRLIDEGLVERRGGSDE